MQREVRMGSPFGHKMFERHNSSGDVHLCSRSIGGQQCVPPLTMAGASSLTASLAALSCVIVFSLYAVGFTVMMLAMAHRWRAVRRAHRKLLANTPTFPMATSSEEANIRMGMASGAPATRTAIPAGSRGSLQASDRKARRLVRQQSALEGNADIEDERAEALGSETAVDEAELLPHRTSRLLGNNRLGKAGSSVAGTRQRLPSSLDGAASAVPKMLVVAKLLQLEDQDLTAVHDEAHDVSVARREQVGRARSMETPSLSLVSSEASYILSGASVTEVGSCRCGHGGHHLRKRLSVSRSETTIATAARASGMATRSAPSSALSIYHSSESPSASLPNSVDATTEAVGTASTQLPTSPVLLRYAPLSLSHFTRIPRLPRCASTPYVWCAYEEDAKVHEPNAFAAMAATSPLVYPPSKEMMSGVSIRSPATASRNGSSGMVALADA
ncbi:hypothetical protein LSCM1_07199 [Leishmania martiniquensis]|uniref:Uncharacterized protein n=1 Tax=Leishmania martiniquensis TaxID=1580590 RepID=A0A836GPJ5_9TRYP|nr:hypothetical protein LSCM1_07199 [Leishmania martiniquensis]